MTDQKTILIITADKTLAALFLDDVALHEFRVLQATSQAGVLALLEKNSIDIVFLDNDLPGKLELDLVHFIKVRSAATEIVIFTSIEHLEEASRGLKSGAAFYLIKPFDRANLKVVLSKLSLRLERQETYLEMERRLLEDMMSGSEVMKKVLTLSIKIAPTSSTILIDGESGTGKEFFAKIIHRMSKRTDGPFIPVNCGAIPDTLFESEMFGHKKGSFTGADRDKAGLVEVANLGTLFLDEIAELSPPAQVKLLRFLQEQTFRRIGETTIRNSNVRVIAATNKNIVRMVEAGSFREDLFYRINVFRLTLPPLRLRKETIPGLAKIFIRRNNIALDKHVNDITKEAQVLLANYEYPGNVRELENIIEHAVALAPDNKIRIEDLPEVLFRQQPRLTAPTGETSAPEDYSISAMEKKHIEHVLQLLNHNYSEAAKELGVSRSTLWRKMKEYGIKRKRES